MTVNEAVTVLRILGFSETMVAKRANEWVVQSSIYVTETDKSKKQRLKQQASLEKYMLRMRLGKKYREEINRLRIKYEH